MDPKKPSVPFFATNIANSGRTGVVHISRVAFDDEDREEISREHELKKLDELGIQIVNQEEEKDEMFEAFLREREVAHRV